MLLSRANFVRSVAIVAVSIQVIASFGCNDSGCQGCDCTWESCMYRGAYDSSIDRQTNAFEFTVPPDVMWRELVKLAAENEMTFHDTAPSLSRAMESDWVDTFEGCRKRWVTRVTDAGHDRYTVSIASQEECTEDGGAKKISPQQKLEPIEWDLIQRTEPERAAQMKQSADKAGKRSGTVGRGVDRGCELGCDACEKIAPPPPAPRPVPSQ